MNDLEDDSELTLGKLTPLERDLIAFLRKRGITSEDDVSFVIHRIRPALRVVQLGQLLGRQLTRKERAKVYRRLQDGDSPEDVIRWLLENSGKPPA